MLIRLFRALTRPFAARVAAQELQRVHEEFSTRYRELQAGTAACSETGQALRESESRFRAIFEQARAANSALQVSEVNDGHTDHSYRGR
jgi:hypothetical protein